MTCLLLVYNQLRTSIGCLGSLCQFCWVRERTLLAEAGSVEDRLSFQEPRGPIVKAAGGTPPSLCALAEPPGLRVGELLDRGSGPVGQASPTGGSLQSKLRLPAPLTHFLCFSAETSPELPLLLSLGTCRSRYPLQARVGPARP